MNLFIYAIRSQKSGNYKYLLHQEILGYSFSTKNSTLPFINHFSGPVFFIELVKNFKINFAGIDLTLF